MASADSNQLAQSWLPPFTFAWIDDHMSRRQCAYVGWIDISACRGAIDQDNFAALRSDMLKYTTSTDGFALNADRSSMIKRLTLLRRVNYAISVVNQVNFNNVS